MQCTPMKTKIGMLSCFFMAVQLLTLTGCGGSKEIISEERWQHMENTVKDQKFTFVGNRIETYGSVQENLTDNPGYLKMDGDQVTISLRYFGSVEMVNTLRESGGIRLEGTASNIRGDRNDQDGCYDLNFSVEKNKSETLLCHLRIFPNNQARLTLNSDLRSAVLYYGYIN